jgi:hypothetical protein
MVAAVAGRVDSAASTSLRAPKVALDPDHELISAYEKWAAAFDKYTSMWPQEEEEYGWDFENKAPSAKFYESTVSPLVDFIENTRPTTLAGIAAKAKFIKRYYDGSNLDSARSFFNELSTLATNSEV